MKTSLPLKYPVKIGIVGAGNIGQKIIMFADKEKLISDVFVHDINLDMNKKAASLSKKVTISSKIFELIPASDIVIEAANPHVVEEIVGKTTDNKKPVIVMSTAGLVGKEYLFEHAEEKQAKIYIPSGAIAGIDALKSVKGKITELSLTTTKPVAGLEGAPYIVKNKINLLEISNKKEKTTIFEGNLQEAIQGFPKNINVAATIMFAAGMEPKIKIVADPSATTNSHEIIAKGDFGVIKTKTDNHPSPDNPKTSFLAVLSAIEILKGILSNVKVGN